MRRERPDPDPGRAAAPLEKHAFTADRGDEGIRLDLVLLRRVRGRMAVSRRRLQAAIDDGQVTVNGAPATRTAARVAAGDRIEAVLPAAARRDSPQQQSLPLDVLFEDDHLLAVNKPPGMVVHPSYKHADGTLFNAVLWHLRDGSLRPRLVNRLDKDTSGLVLVSKSREAHARIIAAMRSGGVLKEYLAIVNGVPKPPAGTISMKLRRDPFDVRRVSPWNTWDPPSGGFAAKDSVTRYETLDCTRSPARLSLVRCELVTGRMHQIRVHLAERGWPILGDRVYGAARAPASAPLPARPALPAPSVPPTLPVRQAPGSPRQALHAWRVSLPHPVTAVPLVIVAPIPADMRAVLDTVGLRIPPPTNAPPALRRRARPR